MPVVPPRLAVWLLHLTVLNGAASSEAGCGQPVISPRIVGGDPASEGSWPWQVSILYNNLPACGGSLIDNQWVLSAAHCFLNVQDNYEVQLGAFMLDNPSSNLKISAVGQIIPHPDYNGKDGSRGDIALVELASPVNFTDYILPICLPDSSEQFSPGTLCWVTGWGQIREGENLQSPKILQELQVPIIDRDQCNELYNINPSEEYGTNPVKDDMICAGYPEGGKDACQGDSGGPLVCKRDGSWTQAGVVSWGDGCAEKNRVGVYTSVPYYANWIQETMTGNGGEQNGSVHKTCIVTLLMSLALALL
ncbi:prostasin-like [Elgaria multicarinata webbii]|uniref:prostasin-like n=1 Tax=Elgaria multicarinata webbii TaxID=159646 RepID=UPI002FCD0E64